MKRFTFFSCLFIIASTHSFALPNDTLSLNWFTISSAKPAPKQDKVKQHNRKTEKQQQQPSQPQIKAIQIKEVPKARRQLKPMAVKPNLKVKPIKIIKPKIKRP